ncbi:MAG TPA: hypothetical protein VJ739_03040, partial [Gemmataceae bacterium]|nr:hypothetical protein [Gemmataceae bacterium]
NKWDRCVHVGAGGLRPDEDLLRDLQAEGFKSPLLFRTCAQLWVDRNGAEAPPGVPEGEQFRDLVQWLERGLTRLEIEAIKARGVSQLLQQLQQALRSACPPDLTGPAERTQAAWKRLVDDEARATADVLLNTLEPYQREIEHHFALRGQQRFHGIMAGYLHLFTRLKYVGSALRERVSLWPRGGTAEPQPAWDLGTFTRTCSDAAASRHLDARGKALANRLLIEAGEQGFPVALLTPAVEGVSRTDWRQRHAQTLIEVLQHVEAEWSRPTGARRWLYGGVVFLAEWLPLVALLAALVNLLWQYFNPLGHESHSFTLIDLLLPLIVLLAVLVILHILIALLLPLRWGAIRNEFQRRLRDRLQEELEAAYEPVPAQVAEALQEERQRVEQLLGETREVAGWLEQREQAASITGLYGR